eukprot:351963-Chlamydomonas_euryale.AAC.8
MRCWLGLDAVVQDNLVLYNPARCACCNSSHLRLVVRTAFPRMDTGSAWPLDRVTMAAHPRFRQRARHADRGEIILPTVLACGDATPFC